MQTKTCTGCGFTYPATPEYFNRKGRSNDTLRPKCKACESAYRNANKEHKHNVDKQYRENNQEAIRASKSDYYRRNRESCLERYYNWREGNREHYEQYQREYSREHAQRKRIYDMAYRERNRQLIISRQRRWYHENIDHARKNARAGTSRYVARKRKANGTYTAADIDRMYKAQKGRCYYCGGKVGKDFHVDHVIPLSRGGSNHPDNLVIACPSCNCSKSDKMPHEWSRSHRLL